MECEACSWLHTDQANVIAQKDAKAVSAVRRQSGNSEPGLERQSGHLKCTQPASLSVLESAHCTAMRRSSHGTRPVLKESQSGLDAREGLAQGKNGSEGC